MRAVAFLTLLALAACGIDGAPSAPGPAESDGGPTIGVVSD